MKLLTVRRRRGIVCQQAVELVTDYLEGALSRSPRRRFEAHLAGCPQCTGYLAQMRATIELAGRITPEDLTPQMKTSSSPCTGGGDPRATRTSSVPRLRGALPGRESGAEPAG